MNAEQALERLRGLGFNFLTLPQYERYIAAERDGFAALLEYTMSGEIRQFSSAGRLIEGQIALLVERGGETVFVAKQNREAATAAGLESYHRFQRDLRSALGAST